jgi:peptidoglycan-associated lipoprotein
MRLVLIAALALGTLGAGCKKKTQPEPQVDPQPIVQERPEPEPVKSEPVQRIERNFGRVHFAFDSTELVDDSAEALTENAEILQEFPAIRVEVQGHADERGTTDYNLALGQRRANTIKERLERLGVPAGRISIVSFGEERPLVSGSGERVWSKNRRAEFRVTEGTSAADIEGTVD